MFKLKIPELNTKQAITIALLIAIVFLGTMFYWYSLRPSIIKEECFRETRESLLDISSDFEDFEDAVNTYYEWCLRREGL